VLGIVRRPGAFSEARAAAERNLHIILISIPIESAVFTEPPAAAGEILEQAACLGAQVAILGDGKLAVCSPGPPAERGRRTCSGVTKEKLAIADARRRWIGAANPSRPGHLIGCRGHRLPDSWRQAVSMVRLTGTGCDRRPYTGCTMDAAHIVVDEITITRCGR
jgi:alcohol dehydrogenase